MLPYIAAPWIRHGYSTQPVTPQPETSRGACPAEARIKLASRAISTSQRGVEGKKTWAILEGKKTTNFIVFHRKINNDDHGNTKSYQCIQESDLWV